ncbi:MAG TPA: hypothetical protein DCQ98_13870 [Planctomycetaceae bacterium]|nr:hypothetical protein [Planctomycetaceae bacterium]
MIGTFMIDRSSPGRRQDGSWGDERGEPDESRVDRIGCCVLLARRTIRSRRTRIGSLRRRLDRSTGDRHRRFA